MSRPLYGAAVDGAQVLVFVGPAEPIPEGFASKTLMTTNMSTGLVLLSTPLGCWQFKSRDRSDVAGALEDLARKLREN